MKPVITYLYSKFKNIGCSQSHITGVDKAIKGVDKNKPLDLQFSTIIAKITTKKSVFHS